MSHPTLPAAAHISSISSPKRASAWGALRGCVATAIAWEDWRQKEMEHKCGRDVEKRACEELLGQELYDGQSLLRDWCSSCVMGMCLLCFVRAELCVRKPTVLGRLHHITVVLDPTQYMQLLHPATTTQRF